MNKITRKLLLTVVSIVVLYSNIQSSGYAGVCKNGYPQVYGNSKADVKAQCQNRGGIPDAEIYTREAFDQALYEAWNG